MTTSYSTEQIAEFLNITPDGVRNYKKRHPDRFVEGQHFYKDGNSLYYTDAGLNLIRELRGEPQSGSTEPQAELQSGSQLLNQLVSRFRPLLKPLARAISSSLKQEFEQEVLSALFDSMEPLTEKESYAILERYGIAPSIDLRTLGSQPTIGYLEGE